MICVFFIPDVDRLSMSDIISILPLLFFRSDIVFLILVNCSLYLGEGWNSCGGTAVPHNYKQSFTSTFGPLYGLEAFSMRIRHNYPPEKSIKMISRKKICLNGLSLVVANSC